MLQKIEISFIAREFVGKQDNAVYCQQKNVCLNIVHKDIFFNFCLQSLKQGTFY